MRREFLAILSFAFLATGVLAQQNAFDDFEKSLMQEKPKIADEISEKDADGNLGEGGEAASDTVANMDAFESSLAGADGGISDDIYQLRERIVEATRTRDTAAVGMLMDSLWMQKNRTQMPIQFVEEECVLLDMKMFDRLLQAEMRYHKTFFDTAKYDLGYRKPEGDALVQYTRAILDAQDNSTSLYAPVAESIENSNLSDQQKVELEMILLLRDAYNKKETGERVLFLARQFVKENPDHPDSRWISRSVKAPLERMNAFDVMLDARSKNKETAIERKLYTGGLGVNVYYSLGGFALGYKDLYRTAFYEADYELTYDFEIYMQFGRFVLSFDYLRSGLVGVSSLGLELGYVLYDSRYFKIRPFVEMMGSAMGVRYKYGTYVEDYGYYNSSEFDVGEYEIGNTYVLGANVDFKFLTTYQLLSNKSLFSLALVSKTGLAYRDMDTQYAKGSGVDMFFDIGLGIYFW